MQPYALSKPCGEAEPRLTSGGRAEKERRTSGGEAAKFSDKVHTNSTFNVMEARNFEGKNISFESLHVVYETDASRLDESSCLHEGTPKVLCVKSKTIR